jgi:hypothetical protein
MNKFKENDIIKNLKTNKLAVILDANYGNTGAIKYSLLTDLNNTHICINPEERFELFYRPSENVHWSAHAKDLFDF